MADEPNDESRDPGAPAEGSGVSPEETSLELEEGRLLDLEEGRSLPSIIRSVQSAAEVRLGRPRSLEETRAQVARALVALLAVVILFSFLTLWMVAPTGDQLEGLLTIIFGPLIALVSAAVGYYFGEKFGDKTKSHGKDEQPTE